MVVIILFQVAHFYNTIDQQMIPSQQAMMLEAAMAFEHIIKNPKAGSKTSSSEVREEGSGGREGGRESIVHGCLTLYTP